MNLSDLQNREVIDISTGRRLGMIIDVVISLNGTISKLVLEDRRSSRRFLSSSREVADLEWKQIIKIGDDYILVDVKKKELK